jgi:HK97 gp10 family phage protein
MANLSVKVDFKKELEKLKEEVKEIANDSVIDRTEFATAALARVTPIDTGYARSRWVYKFEKNSSNGDVIGIIDNDAPYIGILNKGHSRQAPSFFIEKTLIAIGELEDPVVDYLEE